MELAKITSKGQITIPKQIRNKLHLKEGDKVIFIEDGNKIIFANSSLAILRNLQSVMQDEAQNAGFANEEDVADYIKELRKSKVK